MSIAKSCSLMLILLILIGGSATPSLESSYSGGFVEYHLKYAYIDISFAVSVNKRVQENDDCDDW